MSKRRAAVIGHPVRHSLSPVLFQRIAGLLKIKDFEYAALEITPGDLARQIGFLRSDPTFVGLNVTIPHKQSISRLVDETSAGARAIGACNVLHFKSGRAMGHNTDVLGITASLNEQGLSLHEKQAVLFGAGGAALACAYALGSQEAAKVFVLNRNPGNSAALIEKMAGHFPKTRFEAVDLNALPEASISLFVNATPVGMQGYGSDPEFIQKITALFGSVASSGATAFDLIYRPEQTPFLKEARASQLKTLGGLDMLIHQALSTWEIWFSPLESRQAVKDDLTKHLREHLNT